MTYAVRSLVRQPLFTLGAVTTLALGLGINTTIFTFANAAFFRPIPGITHPDELVWVAPVWHDRGRGTGMSYPEYLDYRDATTGVFADLVALRSMPLSFGSGGEPQRMRGQLVTGSYFSALGVVPAVGRLIGTADDRPGASPAAVLSHRLWQQRFGGSPDVLSSAVIINGRRFAVIGIAPDSFHGPALGEAADIWLPLSLLPDVHSGDRTLLADRGASWLLVVGRLRPDATRARAQSAATAVASRLEQAYPETNTNRGASISGARSGLAPESRGELVPLSTLLLGVTAIVLLIACANVANLLLARGAGRTLEISVRAALGASRRRLVRQLLTESLVLGVTAAVAGLLLSAWATDILQSKLPEAEFRGLSPAADLRVVLFTSVLSVLSVCAFGLIPALSATRGSLLPHLRQTAAAGGRSRLQGAFVVAQLSLSLVLLLAGALSLRALQKANQVELGFNPSGVLTASYDLELQNYTPERRAAFRRELRARLAAIPGVSSVGVASMAPLSGTMVSTVVTSMDSGGGKTESRTYLNAAGPGYFEALQIPLLKGRPFAATDTAGAAPVTIVNETLAHHLWGDADPVGRHVVLDSLRLQVIGVARDAKYDEATEDPRPFMYSSIDQRPQLDRETVIIRTASSPAALMSAVRAHIQAMDAALPVFEVQPLSTILKDRSDKQRVVSTLLASFGGVALCLAGLGLYGVMAYAVTQRTREMGIRLALGATPSELTRLITRDGLRLTMIGVAIGGTLSLPLAYGFGALLLGVQIADVGAFALTCVLLVTIGVVAAWLPARRAARLDPIMALRSE